MAQGRSTKTISMIEWILTRRLSMKNSLSPLNAGLRSVTSASFDVSFGPAYKIILSIAPSGVAPGRVLTTAPEVLPHREFIDYKSSMVTD